MDDDEIKKLLDDAERGSNQRLQDPVHNKGGVDDEASNDGTDDFRRNRRVLLD